MAKWHTSETGILRKKPLPESHEDLLVFGYACKLFRDDEKAKYIDQGKHLIPWMGDDKLRIDRYDCRGALSDLSSYEASREGYDAMRWLGLNESERKIEQLCDEERYYSLNANEDEEDMYKEEELKRVQQKTNEFAYSYDVPQNPQILQENPATCEEQDKEYVPRPELDIPVDIAIPKTEKEHARIQKTASFVCKQGPQMEILIKAKQANNPLFSFLNQSDTLYKYYKHVLNALKTGTYKVETDAQEEEKTDGVDHEANDGHYLHPSLLQTSVQTPMPTIPTLTYKPTADCSYSQLVNRIQGSQTADTNVAAVQNKSENEQNPVIAPQNQMNYEQQQQQYYQYYYAMQYYEYYKQLVQQFHSMGGTDGQTIPPLIQEQINAQATAFAQMAYTQYIQQNTTNSYSQIVSNLSQTKESIYPTTPIPDSSHPNHINDIAKAPIIYNSNESDNTATYQQTTQSIQIDNPTKSTVEPPKVLKKPLLSLVHYDSDTEDEMASDNEEEKDKETDKDAGYKIPPDEIKLIIDKMASYVSKNGGDFENIVKSKGDVRFEFLKEEHEYHGYYKFKIKEFNPGTTSDLKDNVKNTQNGVQSKPKDKKIITPVSFSIKKPKEEIPKDIKSALPIEESDEETCESPNPKENTTKSPPDTTNIHPSVTQTSQNIKEIPKEPEISPRASPPQIIKKDSQAEKKSENMANPIDDPILEMIDLTEDLEEKKDARRAEDRIKDKLAAAAREKLASVTKDRALQMERKKKAAAFLKLKSVESSDKTKSSTKKVEKIDDKILVISDGDNKGGDIVVNEKISRKSRSSSRDKSHTRKEESDSEEGEIKKQKKSSKKKKSHHKRKRSRSRHRSKSHYKKVKKRRRRSDSYNESSSSND